MLIIVYAILWWIVCIVERWERYETKDMKKYISEIIEWKKEIIDWLKEEIKELQDEIKTIK